MRKFQLKDISSSEIQTIDLNDGDIIIMKPGCQQKYLHQISKGRKDQTGIRYNLTFRMVN